MSKVAIYYFSGTGNSLHIAREVQKRLLDAELIPIASLQGKERIKVQADTVGIVFPVYLASIPTPVRSFIDRLEIDGSQYIFALATRIGTTHTAMKTIGNILGKQGRSLDLSYSLNMPSNDPKFDYKVPTNEEIAKLETVAHSKLDQICDSIKNKKKLIQQDDNYTSKIPLLGLMSLLAFVADKLKYNLYADAKCTGCGTCEKVCLSGRIKMTGDKPVWQKGFPCYKCSACLNYCPVQSVQIKSYTEKNGRYSHPYATVEDIAGQKATDMI